MTIDATHGPAPVHALTGSANHRFTGSPGRVLPARVFASGGPN